ncbi:MAG TPA: response regulator transcription factor [Bryobacteraceae bacterium]|nr:response regulator transcription factor [Bryobacteraceae bacterium]
MNDEITVLIADDHPIFRKGLAQLISSECGIRVVADTDNGASAIDLMRQCKPRVAIVDLEMPKVDGLGVARTVRDEELPTEVIFLTMHNDKDAVNEALEAGISGYVLKDSAASEVVASIRSVVAGCPYLSPAISSHLVGRWRRTQVLSRSQPAAGALTPAERRIMLLIAEYKTSKEIADVLCVSPRTVENHRANICSKLELHGSHALIRYAVENRVLFS